MSGSRRNPPARSPGFRGQVEAASFPLLRRLHAAPRLLLVGVVAALLVVGLVAPPAAAVPCLVIVVAFLGWLTYLAWPTGGAQRKVLRIVALGLAVAAIVVRATS